MRRRSPNNPIALMLALGLCLGVMVVSANDSNRSALDGRLVSLRDLSVEFSSNSNRDDITRVSESTDGLDFVSALHFISRFIGAADSVSSDDIANGDLSSIGATNTSGVGHASDPRVSRIPDSREALSSQVTVGNLARASL